MEKLELKASIEALIYNWLKFDTETIDIASGMREETNFYVNERTNGFRVVMEYPIGYNDVQGGDIGEIVGVMEYDREFVFIDLFGTEPFSSMLRLSNLAWFKYDWVWVKTKKTGFTNAKNRPLSNYEVVSVFSEGTVANCSMSRMPYNPQDLILLNKVRKGDKNKSSGDTAGHKYHRPSQSRDYLQEWTNYPVNVLNFANEGKTAHPTQKPVALMEYLIKTYTVEGETVLDCFMGSGTTGVACINTNRNFIGIEKDETYFKIAQDRIAAI